MADTAWPRDETDLPSHRRRHGHADRRRPHHADGAQGARTQVEMAGAERGEADGLAAAGTWHSWRLTLHQGFHRPANTRAEWRFDEDSSQQSPICCHD
eukprot:1269054-Pleurochrysis_carterae.AAC.1